jgi:hypothetical protein
LLALRREKVLKVRLSRRVRVARAAGGGVGDRHARRYVTRAAAGAGGSEDALIPEANIDKALAEIAEFDAANLTGNWGAGQEGRVLHPK